MANTPRLDPVSTKRQRIAELARDAPEMVFTSLAHHIDMHVLRTAYAATRKDGAVGLDGQTAADDAVHLEANLQSLLDRFKSGQYVAPPVRRVHIPDAADNRWLREAFEHRIPIIYFLGIAPGRYQAMVPAFISGWDAMALKARVSFGMADQATLTPPENALERKYALRAVKQRLHQASFREAVIMAYNGRCALSGLPEPLLLDAAHIVADTNERFGQPVVPNGLPLSKIHHAAFDAHLIGIDPDYRLHVSERLLGQHDGPMLKALTRLNGGTIHLPNRVKDRPDRDRLAWRFERFKGAA